MSIHMVRIYFQRAQVFIRRHYMIALIADSIAYIAQKVGVVGRIVEGVGINRERFVGAECLCQNARKVVREFMMVRRKGDRFAQ
jgi:hypothetical protein